MQCEEVRLLLLRETPDATLDPDVYASATKHHDGCEACRRVLSRQWKLARQVRNAGRGVGTPDILRARVTALIAAEQSAGAVGNLPAKSASSSRWFRTSVLVGAAASILFFFSTVLRNNNGELGPEFVDAVLADVAAESDSTTSNSGDLAGWLQSRVGYAVEIPDIAEAVPIGGRVTEIGMLRAAAVRYQVDEATLWYFVLPPSSGTSPEDDNVRTLSRAGYQVAIWTEFGARRALVAMLPRDQVRAIAEECRRAALRQTTL